MARVAVPGPHVNSAMGHRADGVGSEWISKKNAATLVIFIGSHTNAARCNFLALNASGSALRKLGDLRDRGHRGVSLKSRQESTV